MSFIQPLYSGSSIPVESSGTNSMTPLSGSSIMVSNGSAIGQGEKGTSTKVLHGNALGLPTYSQVSLTSDVTGVLPSANIDGTLESKTLDGCYIADLAVGFGEGGDSKFLVYDENYDINGRNITLQPIHEYEGGVSHTIYTNGQLLIGKTDGTLAKATLSAGDMIEITNGDGSITISSSAKTLTAGDNITIDDSDPDVITISASGGSVPTTTEYTNTSGNPYTYSIPVGCKFLDIVLIGGGGGGGGAGGSGLNHPTNPGGGGGGGAGMYRSLRVPVESGVTSCTITIGAGGTNAGEGTNGTAGTQSTLVINGKTIYASAGGGGSYGASGRGGGGGGSGGSANGGSSVSSASGGAAGSATSPSNHFKLGIAGIAGSPGQTAGISITPNSPGALTNGIYIIGGAGTGSGSYQSNTPVGGECQGGMYQTPALNNSSGQGTTAGGNGGSSGKAVGGSGAYFVFPATLVQATSGTFGSGGGGGTGTNMGTGRLASGASGGSGYCSITPIF